MKGEHDRHEDPIMTNNAKPHNNNEGLGVDRKNNIDS
jgi:hypothetical protein